VHCFCQHSSCITTPPCCTKYSLNHITLVISSCHWISVCKSAAMPFHIVTAQASYSPPPSPTHSPPCPPSSPLHPPYPLHTHIPTVKPKLPDDFEASTWSKLQAAVVAVHTKQHVATSLEELYRVRGGQPPHTSGGLCFGSGRVCFGLGRDRSSS
jgi:hypothetical protein